MCYKLLSIFELSMIGNQEYQAGLFAGTLGLAQGLGSTGRHARAMPCPTHARAHMQQIGQTQKIGIKDLQIIPKWKTHRRRLNTFSINLHVFCIKLYYTSIFFFTCNLFKTRNSLLSNTNNKLRVTIKILFPSSGFI